MTKTAFTKLMAAILAGAMMTLGLLSCGMTVRATDLMEGIEAAEASGKAADDTFISALADFSIRLYQQSSADCSKGDNFLVSPISLRQLSAWRKTEPAAAQRRSSRRCSDFRSTK